VCQRLQRFCTATEDRLEEARLANKCGMCLKTSEIYKNLALKAKRKDLSESGKCFHKWNGNVLLVAVSAALGRPHRTHWPGKQEVRLDSKDRVKMLASNQVQDSLKGLIDCFLAAHNDVGMDLARIDEIPVSGTYGCLKLSNDGGSTSASLPTISF